MRVRFELEFASALPRIDAPEPKMDLTGIRGLTRANIHDIWRRYKAGEELSANDKIMGDILNDHPMYHAVWSTASMIGGREVVIDGVNPFLHVSLHLAVEEQLIKNDPPEVAQALRSQTAKGKNRHEAMHALCDVLFRQLQDSMSGEKPFNARNYAWKLRKLY